MQVIRYRAILLVSLPGHDQSVCSMAPTFIENIGCPKDEHPLQGPEAACLDNGVLGRGHAPSGLLLDIPLLKNLDLTSLPIDKVQKLFLTVAATALGPVNVPILGYRSSIPGPIVGITCAIHGNEVNGIPVIQRLFASIEKITSITGSAVKGTIIGIPIMNVPGFLDSVRSFDGQDLNRLMPGYE